MGLLLDSHTEYDQLINSQALVEQVPVISIEATFDQSGATRLC
jgi:hypothetical protein